MPKSSKHKAPCPSGKGARKGSSSGIVSAELFQISKCKTNRIELNHA
jgi:hypothetical protein